MHLSFRFVPTWPYIARLRFLKYIFSTFYERLQNCQFLGGTWLSETIQQVKCLFEFGCNPIARGGLFLPGLWHIPARLYAEIRTNTPATLQGIQWRCIYLDGSSKECSCRDVCACICVQTRVCVCARALALCDKGHREVHLLSLISL